MLCGLWDLPGPGIESMSPALVGRFLSILWPGKSKALLPCEGIFTFSKRKFLTWPYRLATIKIYGRLSEFLQFDGGGGKLLSNA